MCPINRIIHRGAIANYLKKVTLNKKMNKILHTKHKENNCFSDNKPEENDSPSHYKLENNDFPK